MSSVSDTSAEARRQQRAVIRKMGAPARLRMAIEMSELVRELALRRISMRQPALSRAESTAILREQLDSSARRRET